MRIEIIKQINDLEKEIYFFSMFDLHAVFCGWKKMTRPSKRHQFRVDEFWERVDNRGGRIERPELPEEIKIQIRQKIEMMIKVIQWEELKW